jgi:PAS domain S-box-containing protein
MLHESSAAAEQRRRLACRALHLLDTPPEERFDRITRTARRLFAVPVVILALVDEHRHWFKSCQGLAMTEVPHEVSLCEYTLRAGREFIVPDTHGHPDLVDHPFVSGAPYVRFYAGHVLRDQRGNAIGTLCVMDYRPRQFHETDLHALRDLAGWAEEEVYSTGRKLTEDALHERESYFRNMANTVPVAIWMSDSEGKCEFANHAWLELTGRSLAQEQGRGWLENVHPDDARQYQDIFLTAMAQQKPFETECRMRCADGTYRWMLGHGAPRSHSGGSFAGYIGSCLDITERKQAETQLTVSLQEKEVLLKEIHHRVKNNLQVVSSLLSLQAGQIGRPDIQAMFRESQTRVQSMAFIHEHLYQSKTLARVDFAAYIRRLTSHLLNLYQAQARGVRLTTEVQEVSLGINTAVPCGLIINELVSNALKYAFPAGCPGEILVSLGACSPGQVQLIVRDTGVGLPTGFDVQRATSLGLQLVTTLTEQLEGTLTVENGQGTAFILTFAAPQG